MTTMVVVASKHDSTAEIGERIVSTLSARGVSAHVKDISEAGKWLYGTDHVVVGLPVYRQGLWGPGKLFLDGHRTELGGKPLFLYAVGGSPRLDAQIESTMRQYPHREIAYFRGAVDSEKLSFLEKLQLKVARQPVDADWRDWPAVEDWANGLLAYGVN